MKAKDIRYTRITSDWPEQYFAHTKDGQHLGCVRVGLGWCKAWCQVGTSNELVYKAKLTRGWWSFETPWERRRHLMKARLAIAGWWNAQNAGQRSARALEAITNALRGALRTNDDNSAK